MEVIEVCLQAEYAQRRMEKYGIVNTNTRINAKLDTKLVQHIQIVWRQVV
jgi:hypothetical protein